MATNVECTTPSPRRRAQSSRMSPFPGVTSLLENPNNDTVERVSMQQELLQEMHAQHIESPGTPSQGRQSMGLGQGLSDVQLAEHYANCVRLSNENKITQKNAFSLHLIDHLKDVVQSKDGTTNFQAAGCSLDASAKIYAYRVDRVYTEALQIANDLGIRSRTKNKKGKDEEGDGEPVATVADDASKQPAKGRKASTLVRNKKSITLNKLQAAKPIDTLIELVRNSSNEGTTGSFFLNHLSLRSDVGGLGLFLGPSRPKADDEVRRDTVVKAPRDILQKVADSTVTICSDFYLTDLWGSRCDLEGEQQRSSDIPDGSRLLSALEEPLDEPPADNDAASFHDDGDGGGDGVDHDRNELLDSPPNKSIRLEEPDNIVQFLAAVPGDYSYFTKNFPSAPAGPEYWRLRLMNKPKPDKAPVKGRKRAKKVVPLLDLKLQVAPTCFARTKKKFGLDKATLSLWTASKLLEACNSYCKVPAISTFMLNNELKIDKIVELPSSSDVQPKDEDYAYDAADDNFCPDAGKDLNDTLVADSGMGACNSVAPQPDFGKAVEDFVGDNLLPRPFKIPKLEVPAFKANKRFDMRQMKTAMWDTLVSHSENKETLGPNRKDDEDPPSEKAGDETFSGMYRELIPKLNPVNRENISVPVAFVALLHLATEQGIHLRGREDMSDLDIGLAKPLEDCEPTENVPSEASSGDSQ